MFAAVDAQYEGDVAAVACVTFAGWTDAVPASEHTLRVGVEAEYQPGEFWRRELPCILEVLRLLPIAPEVVLVDGYVWLDGEGRKGLGAHLFDVLGGGTAVIGVAKRAFHGASSAREVRRGAGDSPLYVTVAGMELRDAEASVRAMHGPYRIPTLLKRVDRLCRDSLRSSAV